MIVSRASQIGWNSANTQYCWFFADIAFDVMCKGAEEGSTKSYSRERTALTLSFNMQHILYQNAWRFLLGLRSLAVPNGTKENKIRNESKDRGPKVVPLFFVGLSELNKAIVLDVESRNSFLWV